MSKPNNQNNENKALSEQKNREIFEKSKHSHHLEESLSYICETDGKKRKRRDVLKKQNVKHKHRHHHRSSKKKKVLKALKITLCVLLGLVILFVAAFYVFRQIGKNSMLNYKNVSITVPQNAEIADDGKTVEYKGKQYRLNENIISILCVGVDNDITEQGGFGTNGQADAIFLLTVDVAKGNTNIIPINRDTKVDIDTYSQSGKFAGIEGGQICLAYSYGKDSESGCKNVAKSVSRLLYGIPVNSYLALDLDAVGVINNICNGVTVTSNETFSYYGAYLKEGQTVTLTDSQATAFIRYRDQSKDDSNVKRMQRQKMFLTAAISELFAEIKSDIPKVSKIYSKLSPYSYSNIDVAQATYLASQVISLNKGMKVEYRSINGEVVREGKYAEFIVDEEKLYETVLDVFYTEQ